MTVSEEKIVLASELEQVELLDRAAEILGIDVTEISGWHINRIRPDGLIDADVPLLDLNVECVPTDPVNVEDLIQKFNEYEAERGGTGQRDAVVVGHVPGDAFYLADGFHRHEVQRIRGKEVLNATITPNLTYEEVVKLRIEYAKTHPEIEFARQVEWMQSVWEDSPWCSEIPNVLTAFRAFEDDYADKYESDEVEKIDALDDLAYESICDWVKQKSKEWGYTPKEIREKLAKAECFDPELMRLVYQRQGKAPEGRISIAHVEVITETYANEFDFQAAVVGLVISHRLTVAQTKLLIDKIEENSPSTVQALMQVVESINIDDIKRDIKRSLYGNKYQQRATQVDKANDAALLQALKQRLEEMQDGDMGWEADDAKLALETMLGLTKAVLTAAKGIDPVLDQQTLREKLERIKEAAASMGNLAVISESVPPSKEDINRKVHELWGLSFKTYENDTPTVYIDGKGRREISDAAAATLYVLAGEEPGKTKSVAEAVELIKTKLADLMVLPLRDSEQEKAVRSAFYEIDSMLRKCEKDNHVIFRSGATRVVHIGLI